MSVARALAAHDVPYPETRDLTETTADDAIDAVGGFPLVVKPAQKRKFETAFGGREYYCSCCDCRPPATAYGTDSDYCE